MVAVGGQGRAPISIQRLIDFARGLIDLGRRCVDRAIAIEFVDRAMALGSLAFTAMIPVGVVVAAILPGSSRNGFADSLIDRFDLEGDAKRAVHQVFARPDDVKQQLSILGALLVVVAALSFTRALQRVLERAWGLPSLGYRATPAGMTWLAAIILWITVFGSLRRWLEGLGGPVFALAIGIAFAALAGLFSPYLLLSRRVPWRRLVPTALLMALAISALGVASAIYMPTAIDESADRYGTIGVAIALVSWLVTIGFAIVLSIAIGSVLGEESSRVTRPGADERGWRRSAPRS